MLENGVEYGELGRKIGMTVKHAYPKKNSTIQISAIWKTVELIPMKYWNRPIRKSEKAKCTRQ
jgi:hypothetical protein